MFSQDDQAIIVFFVTYCSPEHNFDRITSIGPNMCTTIRETGITQHSACPNLLSFVMHRLLYLCIPKTPLGCYNVQCRYQTRWHMYARLVYGDAT